MKWLSNKLSILDKRTERIIRNIVISFGVKGLSILVGFITLPVYIKFFINESVLGIWLTLISMLVWIFTFDLGIGNGLRNQLTKMLTKGEKKEAQVLISSAYISSSVICIIIIGILNFSLSFVKLLDFFKVDSMVISEEYLNISVRILLIGVLFQFVLKLINSILLAMQKAAIPSLLTLTTNILLLIIMYVLPVSTVENNFLIISIIYSVVTNVPLLIATIILFGSSLKELKPSLFKFDFNVAKSTIKLGIAFLWLQLMAMIISNTNNFLISAFIGANEVVEFQIYYRLFSLISTLYMIGIIPIWSSVTEAASTKDYNWIVLLRRRLYIIMGIAVLGEVVVLLFSKSLITLWVGASYATITFQGAIIIGIFDIVNIWSTVNASIGNGLGKLKNQFIFLTIGAVINIPLSYLLSQIYQSWIAIVFANLLSILPYCITETYSTSKFLKNKVNEERK